MKQAAKLLKGSALQIYRDQMLLLLCVAPFLSGIGIKIAVPLIDTLLVKYLDFSMEPYFLMADALILTLGPAMTGMMVGLLMLDERDDGICIYLSVTPVGGKAYFTSRLVLPFAYSLAASLAIAVFCMLGGLPYGWLPAPAVLSSFSGILMAMMLVSIASNKVEGLAVSKLLGIILFGIPLAWFANSYLRVIGCLLPTYWVMNILIKASGGQTVKYLLDFILGMACTSVWFIILYRIFVKKLK